jgi:VanZ family protein
MPSANGRCDRPRFVRDWLPVLAVLAFSFIASSIPGPYVPLPPVWNLDKVLHSGEYLLLGLLVARLLGRAAPGLTVALGLLAATGLGSAWGALDELHQLFTPNRSADVCDWLADTVGTLLGALVLFAWRRRGRASRGAAPARAATP